MCNPIRSSYTTSAKAITRLHLNPGGLLASNMSGLPDRTRKRDRLLNGFRRSRNRSGVNNLSSPHDSSRNARISNTVLPSSTNSASPSVSSTPSISTSTVAPTTIAASVSAVVGHEQMGALLVSAEKITCVTNRCTTYEMLLRPDIIPTEVLDNFQTALVELYASILRLMAFTLRLFAKSTANRLISGIINLNELSNLIDKCHEKEMQVEIEVHNCERMRNQKADAKFQELLESLQEPIVRADGRVNLLLEKLEEREHFEILDWVSKIPYGKHHNVVERTKDTCDWLLSHRCYQEWQDESSPMILWLHGTGEL